MNNTKNRVVYIRIECRLGFQFAVRALSMCVCCDVMCVCVCAVCAQVYECRCFDLFYLSSCGCCFVCFFCLCPLFSCLCLTSTCNGTILFLRVYFTHLQHPKRLKNANIRIISIHTYMGKRARERTREQQSHSLTDDSYRALDKTILE